MATTFTEGEILGELSHYSGTEERFRNPLFPGYVYTLGVKRLAEMAGAYWLLDKVLSLQMVSAVKAEPFQVWRIALVESGGATLVADDGDGRVLHQEAIDYTDFPLRSFKLYLADRVLMLPGEY